MIFGLGSVLWGCATKHAEDPKDILGGWGTHNGVEGTQGAAPASSAPPPVLASRLQCEAAARRIEELALEVAVAEEPDPEARTRMEARRQQELVSPAMKERVAKGTEDCLARETQAREATCIAKLKTAADVDSCTPR